MLDYFRTVKALCDRHESSLEILRIDGAQLTDQALDSISQCDKLKILTIEFCTNMTGVNFQIFHVGIPQLTLRYSFAFDFLEFEIFERIIFIQIRQHST